MRIIDADELKALRELYIQGKLQFIGNEYDLIDKCPTIEAEPVRHTENTTVINTDDVREWKSRIMVCERNSHWGRLYYESDTKHGKWIAQDETYTRWFCSECKSKNHHERTDYCPHCGAKMDLKE